MPRSHHSTLLGSMSLLLALLAASPSARGEDPTGRPVKVTVRCDRRLGSLEIDREGSVGQGGLSEEKMWGRRAAEVRALHARVIRLFLQEYLDVMPAKGRYDFGKMDAVDDL